MDNKFKLHTPEWQLCELAISAEREATAFAADAVRYTEKSQIAREKAASYRAALKKLEAVN